MDVVYLGYCLDGKEKILQGKHLLLLLNGSEKTGIGKAVESGMLLP